MRHIWHRKNLLITQDDQQVWCWGGNGPGQLGEGTRENRSTPALVANLTGAVQVGRGTNGNCALHAEGSVSCWGLNVFGQLGDGTTEDRLVPVTVKGLIDVDVMMISGSCALLFGGTVQCWGGARNGALAMEGRQRDFGPSLDRSWIGSATAVSGLCARLSDARITCWGENESRNCHVYGLDRDGRVIWTDRHPYPLSAAQLIADEERVYAISTRFGPNGGEGISLMRAYRVLPPLEQPRPPGLDR